MATATSFLKNSNSHADLQDIEAQLEKLNKDIAALTRTLADYGNGKLDDAAREARQLKANVAGKSAAAAGVAKEGLMSAEAELEHQIRARPLAAISLAAGLGFLMAMLSKR